MLIHSFISSQIRRTVCVLAIASITVIGTVPSLRAEQPSVDSLLQHFDNVIFGSEYEEVNSAVRVQKWMSPIRVSISAMQGTMLNKPGGKRELKLERVRPSSEQVDMIRKHLTTLVKITGATSEKSDKKNGKPANFVIKFVPRLVMGQSFLAKDVDPQILERLSNPGVCYFLTRSVSTGAMFRSLIVVNNELPADQMDACLLEEMTQAMGMPNDSDIVKPSIFNQASTQRSLSDNDVIMLKTLYDKRLPAGTPRRDALRIGRSILNEHLGG